MSRFLWRYLLKPVVVAVASAVLQVVLDKIKEMTDETSSNEEKVLEKGIPQNKRNEP